MLLSRTRVDNIATMEESVEADNIGGWFRGRRGRGGPVRVLYGRKVVRCCFN